MSRCRDLRVLLICCLASMYYLFVFQYEELVYDINKRLMKYMDASNLFLSKSNKVNATRVNEWTVMLSVNNGYQDFFLNWLAAYRNAHLTYPIIVVAEDHYLVTNIYRYKTNEMRIIESEFPAINRSVKFGSKHFNELSVRRHTYILKELEKGSNVIFSDTDTVWLKDPIPYFTGNYNIWMQLDSKGNFCPGLMAVKKSETSVSFFKRLTRDLSLHPQADQPYINKLINRSEISVAALPIYQFPSGRQYFQKFSKLNRSKAVVVHNNWIISHKAKLSRFIKFKLWFLVR